MTTTLAQTDLKPFEVQTLIVGFTLDDHLGTHTSLRAWSANKHDLAHRAGWLFKDLQYGTTGSDTLFGSRIEGSADEG